MSQISISLYMLTALRIWLMENCVHGERTVFLVGSVERKICVFWFLSKEGPLKASCHFFFHEQLIQHRSHLAICLWFNRKLLSAVLDDLQEPLIDPLPRLRKPEYN